MPGAPTNGEASPTVDGVFAQVAATLADVTTTTTGASTELRRGAIVFAALEGEAVQLRLRPDVADAVLRTPDTSVSTRGEDWVRFAPPTLDRYAEDRLRAWLTTAWRMAGPAK